MKFKEGMRVSTADGKDVGRLEQVVIDPKTKALSHIVVRKGFLFSEDKIVPMSLIGSTDDETIVLREDAGELDALPPFEESHYVPLDELERGEMDFPSTPILYWLPPVGGWLDYPGGFSYPPPYAANTVQNIPEGNVALHEGAEVYSNDEKLLGHVESILTKAPDNQANSFVLDSGDILPLKRIVPMAWVQDIYEDRIILSVGESMLNGLKEYQQE